MKIVLVLIIVGVFLLPSQVAKASNGVNVASEYQLLAQASNGKQAYKVKSRQQATQMVKKQYRAKVVSIQFTKVNGNPTYKAKLLGNDGVVFYVLLDASSGQMRRR